MHLLVVAISFPSPDNLYPGSFIGQQVRALTERVERITVLCPVPLVPTFMSKVPRFAAKASSPERYDLVDGRCEVLFPRYLKAPGNLFLSWTTAQWYRLVERTVARFVETRPVSIVHAHGGTVSSWASLKAARRYNIPCAVTYHGSDVHTVLARRQKGWKLCRDSFRSADLNLPVSRPLETILRNTVQPTGRCETLLLGVDRGRFFPADRLSSRSQVVFVGRIERAKGVYDLLHAWERVLARCSDARLTLVGDDCTDGLFMQQARSLKIDDSITLMGSQPAHQVAAIMRTSRIFCLPSHNEGTPVSVMEALACGLPVVATRVGGIPDIVSHGATGLLVEKSSPQELANALITLLGDSATSVRMGKGSQRFADMHLDIRQTAKKLVDLYQEVIATGSAVPGAQAFSRENTSVAGNIINSTLTD